MIDRELVTRKLTLILADLQALGALARKPREEYLASGYDELAAERLLERLPEDFARSISAAAGLRNRIVHGYEEIDPGRVYDALGRALEDVPRYAQYVTSYLDARED